MKKDPNLKFFHCYGMATVEGLMAKEIKLYLSFHRLGCSCSFGTLGWNGFMAFGIIYWLT